MARKIRKIEEFISLSYEVVKSVSYADYFQHAPLFTSLRIKNTAPVAVQDLVLTLENENGLLAPTKKVLTEIPFENSVEVDMGNPLSPAYFAELQEVKDEKIKLELRQEKKLIFTEEITLRVLPFEYFDTGKNMETLASFVRPKLADVAKLKTDTLSQLKKWEIKGELNGYQDTDKNFVRRALAALFASIRKLSIEQEECALTSPVRVGAGNKIIAENKANGLEMALLFASACESFGFHPIIVLGEREIACGAWLYESCFMDTLCDDVTRLEKYTEEGINNVSVFDVFDLFAGKTAAYSTAEKHFLEKAKTGLYDKYVDIRRCRIARISPLPMRAKSARGYEILTEKESSFESMPETLVPLKKLSLDEKLGKEKQWERRLLDLSMRNGLLDFSPTKTALHILSVTADKTLDALTEKEMVLAAQDKSLLNREKTPPYFDSAADVKGLHELIELENGAGVLRAYCNESELNDTLGKLFRKNKEFDEETGSKILYLAYGFLKWYAKNDSQPKYAPLILQPVTLKKAKGKVSYTLSAWEEVSFNSTLLEYLKQEFNIDIRGLDGGLHGLKIAEILAMIRAEIVGMRGWQVTGDVYFSAFSFARYQMWQDLRKNMDEFAKNPLVYSLLNNRPMEKEEMEIEGEDDASPKKVLTPLLADTSQWEAVALSKQGKTFVLHGPPGTGKSQTITNIIANGLHDGKRVLFVAEKQAALSVVKKRLDSIGLGDFCLELHANKTNKSEVLQKLTNTLALAGTGESVALSQKTEDILRLKGDLAEPFAALHKKRRLGVSIYEAMLVCLEEKNTPELLNIESTFYDSLTEQKIKTYEEMMLKAAAAAKECGGVCRSPFENVNLSQYSRAVRDGVYCAAEVMIAEIKHLKNYVGLFLELYRQRISNLTRRKIDGLYSLAKLLLSGGLNRYFKEDEEEFYAFYNANRRLDACLERYYKRYKKLVDARDYKEIAAWLEQGNTDYKKNNKVSALVKKLARYELTPLSEEEKLESVKTVCEIYECMQVIKENTTLSQYFTFAFGRVDFEGARRSFLSDLYKLHELCATLFMDYNQDSFNSMCIRAVNGYTAPVLQGLVNAMDSFRAAEEGFLTLTKADRNKIPEEDVLEYYTTKAGGLIDNIDMLGSWCAYRATAERLNEEGLTFITDALENGGVSGNNVVRSFRKNVYKNFLQTNIPLDPVLSRFSANVLEEKTEGLRLAMDEFARLTKEKIRSQLISRLPTQSSEGSVSLEVLAFGRLAKSNLRGTGLRKLFEEIPELLGYIAPCMLMSPMTVAQYLKAENGLFDLVIFDEASQMPTAEAIGSLARAKNAIIVGDPKQLPPTTFFNATYTDEENLENEDLESVLDDCLAVGVAEKSLTWHYRSKHESLIAFSNLMYYGSKLCTFPSPDALDTKVKFRFVEDGVYDRGYTKRNVAEADALVQEVIRRLCDKDLRKSSIGVVTFSSVQKTYIERKLYAAIAENKLEEVAFEREEPLFVKNLENVQGDERDVILFSVCYGMDKLGKMTLNFGPLNQAGGWRRLNVAVSRAREEMVVFSSITGGMIDLSKTNSKGVAGLKAFLEFAEKGRTNLAIPSASVEKKRAEIGEYIAEELSSYGYDCRANVGVSNFKIDVAVVDPKDKTRFILAVMCDSPKGFSIKDRNVLQIQTLKRANWNVMRIFSVNYFNNPKREIKKIKDLLDKLTGADKRGGNSLNKGRKAYKKAAIEQRFESAAFVTSGENDGEIAARMKAIVAAEEPISFEFLTKRTLQTLGVTKYGTKVESRLQAIVGLCAFKYERLCGRTYYRKTDKCVAFDKYRVESGEPLRKQESDFTPYEIIAVVKGVLEDKVAVYMDELYLIVASVFGFVKPSEKFNVFVNECVTLGEEKGLFVRSVSDRISLA